MDGVLNVNKPAGFTSHDVVARIRRAAKQKRVGHAGTLDPDATGVLIVCLGSATRIIEYLMDWHKRYRAVAVFGVETDTEDASGKVISQTECSHLTREQVEAVLLDFTGSILQIPPMVSALHHEGKRLYDLARAGEVVERQPRPVEIYHLELLGFTPGDHPSAFIDVECSKGTYIRTLCADIGRTLDCGGHMASLVRTAVGRFTIDSAVNLEDIESIASEGRLPEILHPVREVLSDMPAIILNQEDIQRVRNGIVIPVSVNVDALGDSAIRIEGPDADFAAIGRIIPGPDGQPMLKPDKVFSST